jgi:hypothetical protein
MMALKALFVTGSMGSKIPRHHTHPVNMAQKVIYLEVRVAFFDGVGNIGSWQAKNALKCLCHFSNFFPNNS